MGFSDDEWRDRSGSSQRASNGSGPPSARHRHGSSAAKSVTPAYRLPASPLPESHTMLGEIHRLACSIDLQMAPVDGDSWLTSTLIDFVAFHFARHYPDVHFLPTNFALVDLPSAVRDPVTLSSFVARDILGRKIVLRPPDMDSTLTALAVMEASPIPTAPPSAVVPAPASAGPSPDPTQPPPAKMMRRQDPASPSRGVPRPIRVVLDGRGETQRPLVFFWNIGNMHWNILRIRLGLYKEIELFEPMGRPQSRHQQDGISLRSLPHSILQWLDHCYPVEGGWLSLAKSAIKLRHQLTGFDCGVACLLYAEKCGQGQARQDIQEWTDQAEITAYRVLLQRFFKTVQPEGA